jgi:hypothetical protein
MRYFLIKFPKKYIKSENGQNNKSKIKNIIPENETMGNLMNFLFVEGNKKVVLGSFWGLVEESIEINEIECEKVD